MFKVFLSFLMLVSSFSLVQASDIVYRFDSRSPDEIFRDGFRPWGDNLNLLAHLSGETCTYANVGTSDRDSGFVSTTTSEAFALERAGNGARRLGAEFYVYQIQPDNNAYNTLQTLEHYDENDLGPPIPPNTFLTAATQREVFNVGAIRPNQIIGAFAVRLGAQQNNPNFQDHHSSINPNPFTPREHFGLAHRLRNYIVRTGFPLMSPCIGESGVSHSAFRKRSVNPVYEDVIPITSLNFMWEL